MAFKNQDALRQMMKKRQGVPEEAKPEPQEKALPAKEENEQAARPIVEKMGDKVMATDKNGVLFLQNPALKVTKNVGFNIRITEETKASISYLSKKYKLSQSDLVTALVADAMRRDASGK